MPVVASTEHTTILGYFTAPAVSDDGLTNEVAVVKFSFCHATLLGPPNDEAFHGHPLAAVGLQPFSFSEVIGSPWIAAMEGMNRVHPYHSAEPFAALRHFILPFHDRTFECVARQVESLGLRTGQTHEVVGQAIQQEG